MLSGVCFSGLTGIIFFDMMLPYLTSYLGSLTRFSKDENRQGGAWSLNIERCKFRSLLSVSAMRHLHFSCLITTPLFSIFPRKSSLLFSINLRVIAGVSPPQFMCCRLNYSRALQVGYSTICMTKMILRSNFISLLLSSSSKIVERFSFSIFHNFNGFLRNS